VELGEVGAALQQQLQQLDDVKALLLERKAAVQAHVAAGLQAQLQGVNAQLDKHR
jgi:hypothetical protein